MTTPTRETRGGKDTKKWILKTALILFNKYGTQEISTKRIAKQMGISPGNLYYHFKNKKQIIRALLMDVQEPPDAFGIEQLSPLQYVLNHMNKVVLVWEQYPFFKREINMLLKQDQVLKAWYLDIKQESFELFVKFAPAFIKTEMLEQLNISTESLFIPLWLICEHWINYLEISNMSASKANLNKGIELMVQVMYPYLNDVAIEDLKTLPLDPS